MNLLTALEESLRFKDTPILSVLAGAYWTVVTSRFTGMAATCRDDDTQHSDASVLVDSAGCLVGKKASELVTYIHSKNSVAASIGMATINSLLDIDERRCVDRGALEVLMEKGKGRDVAVVGHFPFVQKLRETARRVWVVEKRIRPGDFADSKAEQILSKAEVVCLTGTTLINHTLEPLLQFCRDAYVVLTGPSSPLSPVLFDHGISAICGARVTDAETVTRLISQGACFKQVKGHGVRLLTLRRDPSEDSTIP